jgi:hypothetical protein
MGTITVVTDAMEERSFTADSTGGAVMGISFCQPDAQASDDDAGQF